MLRSRPIGTRRTTMLARLGPALKTGSLTLGPTASLRSSATRTISLVCFPRVAKLNVHPFAVLIRALLLPSTNLLTSPLQSLNRVIAILFSRRLAPVMKPRRKSLARRLPIRAIGSTRRGPSLILSLGSTPTDFLPLNRQPETNSLPLYDAIPDLPISRPREMLPARLPAPKPRTRRSQT